MIFSKRNRKKVVKFFVLIIAMVLLFTSLTSCTTTDVPPVTPGEDIPQASEEQIRTRIESFVTAYNTGDMETVLDCMDAKSRNALSALMNLMGGAAGSLVGFDLNLADLFSLGVATTPGDFMDLAISSIDTVDKTRAVATTSMRLGGASTETVYFHMLYENGGWYISDMSDKTPGYVTDNPSDSSTGGITTSRRYSFHDGIANVSFMEDGVEYQGLIDSAGKLFFKTEEDVVFTSVGKGATAATFYENADEFLTYIVDEKGNKVATFENGEQFGASGEGLTLVYQRKDTISRISHMFGIIDQSGTWVYPMTDLAYAPVTWTPDHHYAGEGIFAIDLAYGGYLYLNSKTGGLFYVSDMEDASVQFKNGCALIYSESYTQIISPYDPAIGLSGYRDQEPTFLPQYCYLYSDGTFDEYETAGKDIYGIANGFIWYAASETTTPVYLENKESVIIYDELPATMLGDVQFVGDYGLIVLQGVNYHLYFTLIDKNGNHLFDPIETGNRANGKGEHGIAYSDGMIVFRDLDLNYCWADESGKITVTEYDKISAFSNGVALVEIIANPHNIWKYVDKNGQEVMPTIKK